jgi:peptidyl-tRNA hydrolase
LTFPLQESLAQRSQKGFDYLFHARWNAIDGDVLGMLDEWKKMGCKRVVIYVEPPFPLKEFEEIARQLGDERISSASFRVKPPCLPSVGRR